MKTDKLKKPGARPQAVTTTAPDMSDETKAAYCSLGAPRFDPFTGRPAEEALALPPHRLDDPVATPKQTDPITGPLTFAPSPTYDGAHVTPLPPAQWHKDAIDKTALTANPWAVTDIYALADKALVEPEVINEHEIVRLAAFVRDGLARR